MMAIRTDDQASAGQPRQNDEIMGRVSARLKAQLGPEIFASWFQRMHLDHAGKGVCQVSVPTAFLRSWIRGHYEDMLTDAFKTEVPGTLRVDIVVRSAVRGGGVNIRKQGRDAEGTGAATIARTGHAANSAEFAGRETPKAE